MNWLRSSIGKKVVMAASGLALVGFVIMHLLGNLLVFRGSDALDDYAEKLRHLGPLLWGARAFLLAAALLHIKTSMELAVENRRARPQGYRMKRDAETTPAARTMLVSGLLVLAYLVYHLLHFTFRVTNPDVSHVVDSQGRQSVYAMVVLSFRKPPIAFAYLAGMTLVCLHLSHGVASAFQTLGLTNERAITLLSWGSRLFAFVIFFGYVSIPCAVFFGWIR